jgi:hypothetical protein
MSVNKNLSLKRFEGVSGGMAEAASILIAPGVVAMAGGAYNPHKRSKFLRLG